MHYLRQVAAVAGKDLRSELRTKEALNASLSFAVVILLLFSFVVDPDYDADSRVLRGQPVDAMN